METGTVLTILISVGNTHSAKYLFFNTDSGSKIFCLTGFMTLAGRFWDPIALLVFSCWILSETSEVVGVPECIQNIFFSNKRSIFFKVGCIFFLKFLSNRCKEVVKVFSYFLLVRWDTHICMSCFSYVCLPIHLSLTIFQESQIIWSFWVKNSAKWKMTVTFVMCHIWGTV